jgi:uncharacterized caspase-like protein
VAEAEKVSRGRFVALEARIMGRCKILASLVGGLIVLGLSTGECLADKRVALVVGNSAYQNVEQLPNPVKDATAIAEMLRRVGFDYVDLVKDVGNLDFKRALRNFEKATEDADIAVVFYAGHGVEIGGTNYMIPADAKLANERDASDEAIDLGRIMDSVERAKRLQLVILDACRDNPFKGIKYRQRQAVQSLPTTGQTTTRSLGTSTARGLGTVNVVGTETLVAYAAKATTTAEDGDGEHSPFTTALLHYLPEPGLDIRFAMGRVRDEVLKITNNRQEPFVYGSLGGTNISLVPPPPQAQAKQPSLTEIKADYEIVTRVATRKGWEVFLNQYPKGFYSDLAREELAKLTPPNPTDDALAWEKIRDTTDTAVLRNFMKLFPSSPLYANAQNRLRILTEAQAQRAWDQLDKNDQVALQTFIKLYPDSSLASNEAQELLRKISREAKEREAQRQAEEAEAKRQREAARAWDKVDKNSQSAIQKFLARYPYSPLATNEAQERLNTLEREAKERQARREVEEAEAKRQQMLREAAQAWAKVDKNNQSAIQDFITRYAYSPLAANDAQERLNTLDREAKERQARREVEEAQAQRQQMLREAAQAWDKIKNSNDSAPLWSFINRFPDSPLINEARARVAALDRDAQLKLEKAREEAAAAQSEWDHLKETQDRTALRDFVRRYPNSPLALNDAKRRLDTLDREAKEAEERARAKAAVAEAAAAQSEWDQLKETQDRTALRDFIRRYPNSPLALNDAKRRLDTLDRETKEAEEKARAQAAAAEIAAAQSEWNQLKETQDRTALRDFIRRYPNSPLALNDAKRRLDTLDREAKEAEENARARAAAAEAWIIVKDTTDPKVVRNFIKRYPTSPQLNDARQLLDDLLRKEAAKPPASSGKPSHVATHREDEEPTSHQRPPKRSEHGRVATRREDEEPTSYKNPPKHTGPERRQAAERKSNPAPRFERPVRVERAERPVRVEAASSRGGGGGHVGTMSGVGF